MRARSHLTCADPTFPEPTGLDGGAAEPPPSCRTSSFDDWIPRNYLAEYFGEVQEDERHVLRYFVEQMRGAERGPVLFFGCGPGLNRVFSAAPHCSELVLSDYLAQNLAELDDWLRDRPTAHDWKPFVRFTLACESGREPTEREVRQRMQAIRRASPRLLEADAGKIDPLGSAYRGRFATVLSAFCADSATLDRQVWVRYSRNIASLVRPGGLLLTAALRRCRRYRVGSRYFPSANVDESDLLSVLSADFLPDSISVERRDVSQHHHQGYAGILLARARKAVARPR
ncbi:MAG TPA: guanitoxin biosynthesis pre-guanitoxin forming N-methyltransferase GntF [Polyangiaceae bacterium]|nr:guanitoxin biosynthesis pre-guanitoxin forming N-methyltransferase GntF [Polyangiaceae bacterium]